MNQLPPIPIVKNDEGLYEGNIIPYYQAFAMESTGIANPYHNLRHGTHVMWNAYEGGAFHHLPPREMRNLVIAAPLHDANHSGKIRGKDREEIENALIFLRAHLQPEDRPHLSDIEELIWATEYPYTIPEEKLSVSQRILRDADMSQNFSPVWMQQSWIGLAQEMGMDPTKLLMMRPEFLRSIHFHSLWGKHTFEPQRLPAIEEALGYIDLLLPGSTPAQRKAA